MIRWKVTLLYLKKYGLIYKIMQLLKAAGAINTLATLNEWMA